MRDIGGENANEKIQQNQQLIASGEKILTLPANQLNGGAARS
jgi:hypothetical protein